MPESRFHIVQMRTQDDADAVMFELQDLPCVSAAGVDLPSSQAWVEHTRMVSGDDIAAKLLAAGYSSELV